MASATSTPIRVFVLTPYPYVLWGLERLIESSKVAMQAVGGATTCIEALQQIDGTRLDIIVIDGDVGRDQCITSISRLKTRSGAKLLVLTGSRDELLHGDAVLAGASGVVGTASSAETILAAIVKVHQGQLWLNRATTGRIFMQVIRGGTREAGDPDRAKIESLTNKERELLKLAAHHVDATGKTLARLLNVSEPTVRNYLTSIYNKLNVRGRIAMYAYAHKHGLTLT